MLFFFFKQKTAYEMRISDWSSDVCSSDLLLRVEGLHTYYGRAHILADLALEAGRGEVVVLLGRNGAGKSTTMKSVIGLVPAAKGTVTFEDKRIDRMRSEEHTSELQSLMRTSYAVFCLKKKNHNLINHN